jgi:topoisomerase-4 subunit A
MLQRESCGVFVHVISCRFNILTGDGAAASRYIELVYTKFALEVIYSPKITDWECPYDGRKS